MPHRHAAPGQARVRLVRLIPYAAYLVVSLALAAVAWDRVRPAWLVLLALTCAVLFVVQMSLDFVAAADAHGDAPSPAETWRNIQWTVPITLLCTAPIPVLGACLIAGGGTFFAACLVLASPVLARILHDRCRGGNRGGRA